MNSGSLPRIPGGLATLITKHAKFIIFHLKHFRPGSIDGNDTSVEKREQEERKDEGHHVVERLSVDQIVPSVLAQLRTNPTVVGRIRRNLDLQIPSHVSQ